MNRTILALIIVGATMSLQSCGGKTQTSETPTPLATVAAAPTQAIVKKAHALHRAASSQRVAATAPPTAPPTAAPAQTSNALVYFDTEGAAQAHCPSDTVVWLNTNSGIYHYSGQRWYGNTSEGAYVCEQAAIRAGDRATENGQ